MRKIRYTLPLLLALLLALSPTATAAQPAEIMENVLTSSLQTDVVVREGEDFIEINEGRPDFYIWQAETTEPAVVLSAFDELGRTGPGFAVLGPETLPTEPRGQLGNLQPAGWQSTQYDDRIDGGSLYNRSHVIGYQLCGDNATPENLFTGTRHLNAAVMVHFEDRVASHIEQTQNHVLYRVTPVYLDEDHDLVPYGVQMEAYSIEDHGALQFNVFCFNYQPGVFIDYATGESEADPDFVLPLTVLDGAETGSPAERSIPIDEAPAPQSEQTSEPAPEPAPEPTPEPVRATQSYVLNKNTRKFHYPWCSSASDIKPSNRWDYDGTRDEVISMNYVPCKRCNP